MAKLKKTSMRKKSIKLNTVRTPEDIDIGGEQSLTMNEDNYVLRMVYFLA